MSVCDVPRMALLSPFPAIDEVAGASREDCANRDLLAAYAVSCKIVGAGYGGSPSVTPEMSTELAALVVSGRKRATCSLARAMRIRPQHCRKSATFVVVVDGQARPQCIYRRRRSRSNRSLPSTTSLRAMKARRAAAGLVADDHRDYFSRQAERDVLDMHDMIEAVFERFEIVWPARPDT